MESAPTTHVPRSAAIAVAACLLASSPATANHLLIAYAYRAQADNRGIGDNTFSDGAIGRVWQQMGFIGDEAQGYKVATVDPQNPLLLVLGGEPVGRVLYAGNEIVGYENLDQTVGAFNIDTSYGLRQAWLAVMETGKLNIYTHGGKSAESGRTYIEFDDGAPRAGVKPDGSDSDGTGYFLGAYELPPRPDANIEVVVNSCFSALDTDDNGTLLSVVSTFTATVPGSSINSSGSLGVTKKVITIQIKAAAQKKAEDAISKCAMDKGFTFTKIENGQKVKVGHSGAWIGHKKFLDQRQTLVECLAAAKVAFDHVGCTYEKNPPKQSDADAPAGGDAADPGLTYDYYLPVLDVGLSGATMLYDPGVDFEKIEVAIPPGSLDAALPIFVHPSILDPAVVLPCGTVPSTFVATVESYAPGVFGELLFVKPATLSITNMCGHDIIGLYRVDGSALVPHPYLLESGKISAQIESGGTFVALRQAVPEFRADLVGDGVVDGADLGALLASWGESEMAADLDCDSIVDAADLGMLLGAWGPVAPEPCP